MSGSTTPAATDFRTLDVSSIAFGRVPVRGTYAITTPKPLAVQTPDCRCVIALNGAKYSVALALSSSDEVHVAFARFVRDVETKAQTECPMVARTAWFSCLDPETEGLRLSAFDATHFFDASGQQTHAFPGAFRGAACLLELAGVWTTGSMSGLRWTVVQVREVEPPPPDAPPHLAILPDDE